MATRDETMPGRLVFRAVPHPDGRVRHAGFELGSSYVEQCWMPVVGPTSVALLRRFPLLWGAGRSAPIDPGEFARSVGLPRQSAASPEPLWAALRRLDKFGLARVREDGSVFVFDRVAPLSNRQLRRVPGWTRAAHERLVGEHLARLARKSAADETVPAASAAPDRTRVRHQADALKRLDRLQRPAAIEPPGLSR